MKFRRVCSWSVAVLSLAFVMAAGCDDREPSPGARGLILKAQRLFDGTRFVEPPVVLLRDGVVEAVGDSELMGLGAPVQDYGNATIMPGVIDLHVHTEGALGALVEKGVTTAVDLGAPLLYDLEDRPGHLRLLQAGRIITVRRGYPIDVWGRALAAVVGGGRSPESVVRSHVRGGADVIKIALEPGPRGTWPMLSRRQVVALSDAAHRHDLLVFAHVSETRGLKRALAGGVDVLAHVPCRRVPKRWLARVVERNVSVVGTLHVQDGPKCDGAMANARRLVSLGGRLLYGSDFGNPGIPVGPDVAELRLMRLAGLSGAELLAAATRHAAETLGLGPLGSIVPGAPADLIVVPDDPSVRPGGLDNPSLVISGGVVVTEAGP